MLIAEIKRQNKPYGIYFDNITNGFTTTQRGGPSEPSPSVPVIRITPGVPRCAVPMN